MDDFGPFDGRVWLDTAHQGALPRVAVDAAERALRRKREPYLISDEEFRGVPARAKRVLGPLLGVRPEEIILGNSASYGLHLLVQGLPLVEGDEVLVVENDFPATIVSWLPLECRGVKVRRLRAEGPVITAAEVAGAITGRTRVFCCSWVFSFSGYAADVAAISAVCRDNDIRFVVNASQALGARHVAVNGIDAVVSCGFKWLCGPYGTGLAWIGSRLLDEMTYDPGYWIAHVNPEELSGGADVRLKSDLGAERYDVFGAASFLNLEPWTAAVQYLRDRGVDDIAAHDQKLVARLIGGLPGAYRLLSPRTVPERSTLVLISHQDQARNQDVHATLRQAGVYVSLRSGNLRIAPHVHNTEADIDRFLDALE